MADEFGPTLEVIGKRNLDPVANEIVKGTYYFAGDHFPGKLFGRVMGSPYAHAKIKSIDTSAAAALPGVKSVITADDHAAWSKTLLSWGQEVAAVAAVDEATAERAIDLIKVDYDVLPFIIDHEDAMKPGAINAGVFADSNVQAAPSVTTRGDTAKGFQDAEVVFEDTTLFLRRHGMNHMEPESSLAWWVGDECFLHCSNQSLFGNFRTLCSHIKMPHNKVHMRVHGIGGGWGGRGMTSDFTTAALLSKKAGGLPVFVQRTRRLQEPSRRCQYEPKLYMKMGCKKDGTMTAVEGKWWGMGGRTGAPGSYDLGDATWNTNNYYTETRGVATNTGPGAGYRCLAHSGATIAEDYFVEGMAAKLGMNPLAFRRKMFVTDDMPFLGTGTNQRPFACAALRTVLEKVVTLSGYESKYHAPNTKQLADGRMHGIGIHCHNDSHGGGGSPAGIIINMNTDGSANFLYGTTRVCTGGPGTMAGIIAETLGLNYKDVNCGDWGSTDSTAECPGQFGSGSTVGTGLAATNAALDVRNQLFAYAVTQAPFAALKATAADLDAKAGTIFLKSDPTKTTTHATVMAKIDKPVIGRGVRTAMVLRKPVGSYKVGETCVHRSATGSCCEVAVDPDTGEWEILSLVYVTEAGRVLDRIGAEGMIISGLEHATHKMKYWAIHYDPATGIQLSQTHVDNKAPTMMDVPFENHQFAITESIGAFGPYGGHGFGEPPCANLACVANAINNAVGTKICNRPIYPTDVLKAMGKI